MKKRRTHESNSKAQKKWSFRTSNSIHLHPLNMAMSVSCRTDVKVPEASPGQMKGTLHCEHNRGISGRNKRKALICTAYISAGWPKQQLCFGHLYVPISRSSRRDREKKKKPVGLGRVCDCMRHVSAWVALEGLWRKSGGRMWRFLVSWIGLLSRVLVLYVWRGGLRLFFRGSESYFGLC